MACEPDLAMSDPARRSVPFDIGERTFEFACGIVRFCRHLARADWASQAIARQLLDAGTSIGANVDEAQCAYSRRELACKNSIALKESRETNYWLRLIDACDLAPREDLEPLRTEAHEIAAILGAIVKKARMPKNP